MWKVIDLGVPARTAGKIPKKGEKRGVGADFNQMQELT